MKKVTYIALVVGLLLLYACKKIDFSKVTYDSWNPNLAIPLAYGTFDVYILFDNIDNPDDIVNIDPNSGVFP